MKITITPDEPLAVPPKTGNGWKWTMPSGHELTVSARGWIDVDGLELDINPTPDQWQQLAAVALYQAAFTRNPEGA